MSKESVAPPLPRQARGQRKKKPTIPVGNFKIEGGKFTCFFENRALYDEYVKRQREWYQKMQAIVALMEDLGVDQVTIGE